MKISQNTYGAILIVLILGGVFYAWRTKVASFEIDYAKVSFEGQNAQGITEKNITDCVTEAMQASAAKGKMRAEEVHFNFFCRCVKYNAKDPNDNKDEVTVNQKCWNWTAEFFDKPGLFDK